MKKKFFVKRANFYKKYISILIVISILLPSFVFGNVTADENQTVNSEKENLRNIIIKYQFSSPIISEDIIDGDIYHSIKIKDIITFGNPGEPCLPIKGSHILLPPKTDVKEITIKASEKKILGYNYKVLPGEQPKNTNEKSGNSLVINEEIYNSNKQYPEKLFESEATYYFRGYPIHVLSLYPVQYFPSTGELFYYEELIVEIKTKNTQNDIHPLFRNLNEDESELLNKIDNPETLMAYQNPIYTIGPPKEDYDLLILTIDEFKNSFERLANQHNVTGKKTIIKTLSEIDGKTVIDIRNFIKQIYLDYGVEYVLLGGDVEIIRSAFLTVITSANHGDIVSDLYYGCLDGTFNYDQDQYWGEPTDGENGSDVDLYAEVYVGRAPASTKGEIELFINKTLEYMRYDSSIPFLKKVLLVGEDLSNDEFPDYAGDDLDTLIDDGNNITYGIPPDEYTFTKLYERDGDWSVSDLINKINQNHLIVHHYAHGNQMSLGKFKTSDINDLSNYGLFFMYSQACKSGNFGYKDYDSIGEELITGTNYGAFAVIMNSNLGWTSYGTEVAQQFYDAVFGENISEFSRANQDSKEELALLEYYFRWLAYELNLLGDPVLSFDQPDIPLYNAGILYIDHPSHYKCDENININIKIVNSGRCDIKNVTVEFFIDDIYEDVIVIPNLYKYEEKIVTFDWSTQIIGQHNITIKVSMENQSEIYYLDNEKKSIIYIGVQNIDNGKYYNMIQEAIDDSFTVNNNTIFVPQGMYRENIFVNKNINIMGIDRDNTILIGDNSSYGIQFNNVENIVFRNFTIMNFSTGIYVVDSSNITIAQNIILENNNGIVVSINCSDNHIFLNSFVNTQNNAINQGSINYWDNGYHSSLSYYGGNYWSDYLGTDLYRGEQQDEIGSDGYGDISYDKYNGSIIDNYPLISPCFSNINIDISIFAYPGENDPLPVFIDDMNYVISNRTALIFYGLTDNYENDLTYEWDFNDDGNIDGEGLFYNYFYGSVGNYTVWLFIKDNGVTIGFDMINIITKSRFPYEVRIIAPDNNSNDIPLDTDLTFYGGDPDEKESLIFKVLLGTDPNNLSIIDEIEYIWQMGDDDWKEPITINPGILLLNTTYCWQVKVTDEYYQSTVSPIWFFTTTETIDVDPPSNPYPINGLYGCNLEVDLFWSCYYPDYDSVVYDIYFGIDNPPQLFAENVTNTSFSIGFLENETTYYWKINAKDIFGFIYENEIWNFTTGRGYSKILRVDDDANYTWYNDTNFLTIQEAIDVANNGDTIFIKNGSYDSAVIRKPLKLIGENKNSVEIYCDGGYAFDIWSDNVELFSMNIFNNYLSSGGILIYSRYDLSNNCIIEDVNLSVTVSYGIDKAIETISYDNSVLNNLHLKDIFIVGDYKYGIKYTSVLNGLMENIFIKDCWVYGIHLSDCVDIQINKCFLYDNGGEESSAPPNRDEGSEPTDYEKPDSAIYLKNTSECKITLCNVTENFAGIRFDDCSNQNQVFNNIFIDNNNPMTIGRYDNAYDYGINNSWDNGYSIGGNYWSDYTGIDNNSDGFGDDPYIILDNGIDNYPKMNSTFYDIFPDNVFVDDDFDSSVHGWGYTNFSCIQSAIDIVNPGGNVYISDGVYFEKIVIEKPVSLFGKYENLSENALIQNPGEDCILEIYSSNVTISNLTFFNLGINYVKGIVINAENVIIKDNFIFIYSNGTGIDITSSENIIIKNNYIRDCEVGITIIQSEDINFIKNTVFRGEKGLITFGSSDLLIKENNIYNYNIGLYLVGGYDFSIYNNIFNNSDNVEILLPCINTKWDNGPNDGGNYWSDYTGVDNNNDGIGDIDYLIDDDYDYYDYYPYILPLAWYNNPPDVPTIECNSNKKILVANKNYKFTLNAEDLDGDNVSYFIDWGDGNNTGWTQFYPSGQDIIYEHSWDYIGPNVYDIYTINIRAKDEYWNVASGFGYYTVKMAQGKKPLIT